MTCNHPACDECTQEYLRIWDNRDKMLVEKEKFRRACHDLDMLHRRKQGRMAKGLDTADIDCHLDRIRRNVGIHAGPLRDSIDDPSECCKKRYFCPTTNEYECAEHSGFSHCCYSPEKHIYFLRGGADNA